MYFIAGITGQVGGAVAQELLRQGHAVRTLARAPEKAADWARQGVEVQAGDFTDAAAVAQALEGVEGAYLMMPPELAPAPGFPLAKAVVASYREALVMSPPPRLVVLSSIGSEQANGLGNVASTHLLEEALENVPFPVAVVRAATFLENYAFAVRAAAESGWFDTFLTPTDRAIPMIATADVGREIARHLVSFWTGHKVIELGTPHSPDDIARAMSEVLDRPVRARSIPREQWPAVLEAVGLASGTTAPFEEMQDGFNSGWLHFGVPGTEPVAGTTSPAAIFK